MHPIQSTKVLNIITYGTFDLFHLGHLKLLQRIAGMGHYLTLGLSTDSFNEIKGKRCVQSYNTRRFNLMQTGLVHRIIPEESWDQKVQDITQYHINRFVMGSDWQGVFDALNLYCEVVYLPRTEGISSTCIRRKLGVRA